MQDKAAFAKFQANVRAIAAANLRNPKYFQALNQYRCGVRVCGCARVRGEHSLCVCVCVFVRVCV